MATIGCINDSGVTINWTGTMPGVLIGSEQTLTLKGPPQTAQFPSDPTLPVMGLTTVPAAIWQAVKASNASARVQNLLSQGILIEVSLP
jgi:hypothetical protein